MRTRTIELHKSKYYTRISNYEMLEEAQSISLKQCLFTMFSWHVLTQMILYKCMLFSN